MILVTGAAGFIGSNIVRALNVAGQTAILAVDNLERGEKFLNLRDLVVSDYMDKRELRAAVEADRGIPPLSAILHQGACSDTMEYDGRYMLDNNFTYSKLLLHYALRRRIPFVYASSAAVYGPSQSFAESPANERPLNVYGYSKLLFDQYVRRLLSTSESTIVGLRYFNIYGPREGHKGRMASIVYQLYRQVRETGTATLFRGTHGYADGEQRRDFTSVADVAKVNLHFARQPNHRGIYNVGTGRSRSFNDVARAWIDRIGRGEVRYTDMPAGLAEKYQSFTEADPTALRSAGYTSPFLTLEEGVAEYADFLASA